jgi:hypothetical protein
MTTGAGNVTKDLRERHGDQQENTNGDQETTEADRSDGQPSGNERGPAEKGACRRIH